MKALKNIFLFLFFLGFFFVSCKKDNPITTPIDFGYNYFPNDTGHYVIYQVDSTWQDDKSNRDTTYSYLLKEKITAVFTDNSGRPTLRIERYYKNYKKNISYDSLQWVGPRVWSANRTAATAEKVEENIRYIKLVFPVKSGKQWNGNVYNMLGDKEYQITSADQPDAIGAMHFDSVVAVTQFQQIDLVESHTEKEKYARNVGLIYKQNDSLNIQPHDSNDLPPYDDTIGYTRSQKIISYGK